MSIDPAFFKRLETTVPGPRLRHPQGRPPRARHLLDQVRPRRRPHRRPDQPLQHDVRPLLHGRQPGRLRPRARVGGDPEDPRRRGLDQAAPPALRPVLRRRADALAALPRGHRGTPARSATSRSSAPRTASASRRTRRSRRRRRRPGLRFAYLQFDGVGNEANQHRKVGNLFDVKLRAIENLHARRRRHARRDGRQRRQQRPGRRHRRVSRIENIDKVNGGRVPAGVLHRPRRGHRRRDAHAAALHAVAPRARREGAGRHHRADARLVPALGVGPVLRPE